MFELFFIAGVFGAGMAAGYAVREAKSRRRRRRFEQTLIQSGRLRTAAIAPEFLRGSN